MYRPQADDDVPAIDRRNSAPGEALAEQFRGQAVLPATEPGHQDDVVSDMEIEIARRQSAALPVERFRHGKFHDIQPLTCAQALGGQPRAVVAERAVVRVFRIGFHRGHHTVCRYEPCNGVHVTVGVVTVDAALEPDDLMDVESVLQAHFDVRPTQVRIAIGVQQALLCGQQRARPVHIHRTAFQHHAGDESRRLEGGGHCLPGRGVLIARQVFSSPGIETEIQRHQPPLVVDHEYRTVVANPGVVGGHTVKRDPLRGNGLTEQPPRVTFVCLVEHVDSHPFGLSKGGHDGNHRGLHRAERAGPRLRIVGPRQPGGAVRLPLCRHPEPRSRRPGTVVRGRPGIIGA